MKKREGNTAQKADGGDLRMNCEELLLHMKAAYASFKSHIFAHIIFIYYFIILTHQECINML